MEIGNKIIKQSLQSKIATTILTGTLFAGSMSAVDYGFDGGFDNLFHYVFQGVFFGILMGFGFPYLIKKFGNKFSSKLGKNITPELADNENIEIEGPANLFRGLEGVGGKLFLTNKKLIFKSHKINIQKGQTDIDYSDISEIIKRKTAKIINNGIRIKTNDGKEFDFVVNERDKWIEELNERIN